MHNKRASQMIKKSFTGVLLFLSLGSVFCQAQDVYSGSRRFDGEHRNEVSGYLSGGRNVVTNAFVGESFTYTHHFTDRWSIRAGEQAQFIKGHVSLDATGTYRLPTGRSNLYFDARVVNSAYTRWDTYELLLNASAHWQTAYVDLRFGLSYIHYYKYKVKEEYRVFTDAGYTEPPAFTVGFGVNIKPRTSPWNVGAFIRNYDHYYYENWNINWGLRFYATLPWKDLKVFGEFNVRPAGSLSQLATRYEGSLKLGTKYAF